MGLKIKKQVLEQVVERLNTEWAAMEAQRAEIEKQLEKFSRLLEKGYYKKEQQPQPVEIYGVEYPSMLSASREVGLSRYRILKNCADEKQPEFRLL